MNDMSSTQPDPVRTLVKRLGVIGDVHAEDARLEVAITFLRGAQVDDIICTGDIVDGKGCPDRSIELLRQAGIRTVRGNHDRWILEDKARHIPDAHDKAMLSPSSLAYLEDLPAEIIVDTALGKLLLCHGVGEDDLKKIWPGTERMPPERCTRLDALIASDEYSFMINGHMHFRTVIHFESLTLINAGTLKGDRWPGFSLIDFEHAEISAFEFDRDSVTLAKRIGLGPAPEHTVWKNTQCFTGQWNPVRLFDAQR